MPYEALPEGYYRKLRDEYFACTEAGLMPSEMIDHCADAATKEILSAFNQTHMLLTGAIPKADLEKILTHAEKETIAHAQGILPFIQLTCEDLEHFYERPTYKKIFTHMAQGILASPELSKNERYVDMALWITENFDHFVGFREDLDKEWQAMFFDKKERNLKKQMFLDGTIRFSLNLRHFLEFFGGKVHPVLYLAADAPMFNKEQTHALIDRFYGAIQGLDKKTMRDTLDGKPNGDKLTNYRQRKREICADKNPEEIIRLGEIATRIFTTEFDFMVQGASRNVTVILPRWGITTAEEFAGDWQGCYHPFIERSCCASAYGEESRYIDYIVL